MSEFSDNHWVSRECLNTVKYQNIDTDIILTLCAIVSYFYGIGRWYLGVLLMTEFIFAILSCKRDTCVSRSTLCGVVSFVILLRCLCKMNNSPSPIFPPAASQFSL